MAVNVYLHDGDDVEHKSASKWTVDDNGFLHVIDAGTVATYAAGCWRSIEQQ